MKYVHHPDLTCLSHAICQSKKQTAIERYTYPFTGLPEQLKLNVRQAVYAALEARENRGVSTGHMHVELDEDEPGAGRVVDHVPRDTTSTEKDA